LKEFSPEEKKKQAQQEERRRKALAEKKKKNVPSEDSLLSESLAKIYISRGKYDKAYEIIRSLSLKYPKKSIYFADQLRFLQKLILNSKHKK
ncbi:MAG: tetratricopeptide repeat protein, partial [Paramuribaculum sp.]|nr:tetratricopeptide repeat protein [Paramuribaculum sp.]